MAVEFPEIEGWSPTTEVRVYDSKDLWKLINGAAEQFLAYGFQFLRSCDLASDELAVTIDIYDMTTPLNAFGMYATERPEARKTLAIGAEAVVSPPYQCLLLKERYYVKVDAYKGEITEASGKALLRSIAKALPGEDMLPPELRSLPQKGKVPGSEGFARQGYLGLSELRNCIYAKYEDEKGERYGIFIVIPEPEETAKSIWERMSSKWKPIINRVHPILLRKIPYRGLVGIMYTDKGILGVTDSRDESELLVRLESIKQ